ncbi:MAG: hypothetical protein V2A34_02895 [Lentisphaerota bacterium]
MKSYFGMVLVAFALLVPSVFGQEAPETALAPPAKKSLGHKALFYLPNRLLDLVDIFRCRIRAGSGLAVDLRMTKYVDNFIGKYNSVYVGLPGPRMAPVWPAMAGKEGLNGVIFLGVSAADDAVHPPDYSPSECDLGVQFLLVGLDLGMDPVELGDFLAGFIMRDVRGDDR